MAAPSNAVDRLIEKVKLNVGRAGDPTMDDYTIVWINEGQTKVANKANFWFLHTNTTVAFSDGDNVEDLPSDFKDDDAVWLEITNGSVTEWVELDYMDWMDARRKFDQTTESQPSHYIIEGNTLVVYPIPDDDYTVRLDYYKYLADLEEEGTSNDLLDKYPEVLESYATHKAFMKLREFDESANWYKKFEMELRTLVMQNAERELPDEMVLRPRPDVKGTGISRIKGRIS